MNEIFSMGDKGGKLRIVDVIAITWGKNFKKKDDK